MPDLIFIKFCFFIIAKLLKNNISPNKTLTLIYFSYFSYLIYYIVQNSSSFCRQVLYFRLANSNILWLSETQSRKTAVSKLGSEKMNIGDIERGYCRYRRISFSSNVVFFLFFPLMLAHYYPFSTSSMATICWHIFCNNILIYIIQSFLFSRIYNVMSQKLFVIFFYILNQLYYWFQNEIFGLPFRLSSFICYLVFFGSLAFFHCNRLAHEIGSKEP